MSSFFHHLHPPAVRTSSLAPGRTLGLGLVAASLVVLLCASGLLLSAYYAPTATDAYASVLAIEDGVLFGAWLRAVHHWGAYALLVVVALHALRVLGSGTDRARRLNWRVGLALASVVLMLAVTGYILPWDAAALALARVSTGLLAYVPLVGGLGAGLLHGGSHVGALTLVRANALHVAVLPPALIGLGAWHLWRIRKDGGLVGEPGELVPAWPHLVLREAVVLAVVALALALVAALVPAPLGPAAGAPASVAKAPWFLLGLQEMASSSLAASVAALALVLVVLVALPSLDGAAWVGRPALASGAAALAVLAGAVALRERGLLEGAAWRALAAPSWLVVMSTALTALLVRRRTRSWRAAALAALAGLAAAYVGFTLLGACRGPLWRLAWPWEGGGGL